MGKYQVLANFSYEDPSYEITVEDDGRVGFAFFSKNDRITGHVWLYNRVPGPEKLEMPVAGVSPLNPRDCVKPVPFEPLKDKSEAQVVWKVREGAVEGAIYIRGRLHALVGDGDWPGWCLIAAKDSPLARTWSIPGA